MAGDEASTLLRGGSAGIDDATAVGQSSMGLALLLTTISGLTTGLGGLLVVLPQGSSMTDGSLGMWQAAAAGFMCSVTLVELAPEILSEGVAWYTALTCAALGALLFFMLKALIPEPDLSRLVSPGGDKAKDAKSLGKVLWSGLLTAISLALHNLPEGMAVSMAALHGLDFGLPLTVAIAAHNIPEGVAVALPVYFATRSRLTAFLVALASGLAEPAGVLVVYLLGRDSLLVGGRAMALLLSCVGGVMLALSFLELVPQALALTSRRETVMSFTGGFLMMTALMLLLDVITHRDGS